MICVDWSLWILESGSDVSGPGAMNGHGANLHTQTLARVSIAQSSNVALKRRRNIKDEAAEDDQVTGQTTLDVFDI